MDPMLLVPSFSLPHLVDWRIPAANFSSHPPSSSRPSSSWSHLHLLRVSPLELAGENLILRFMPKFCRLGYGPWLWSILSTDASIILRMADCKVRIHTFFHDLLMSGCLSIMQIVYTQRNKNAKVTFSPLI